MKKEIKIILLIVIFVFHISFCSCSNEKMIRYYSQQENYTAISGTVSYINYNEDSTQLYIAFSELSQTLDDNCFKIVGENLIIVRNNGIDSKLEIGKQVMFITAPHYFGDGCVMPIVSITIDGIEFLSFEDGLPNFLNWIKTRG